MEEVLIIVVQFLFELVLNVLSNLPLEWPTRNRNKPETENIVILSIIWFSCGCIFAGFTLIIVKHSIISILELRIASLVLAPIISAFLYRNIAIHRARYN